MSAPALFVFAALACLVVRGRARGLGWPASVVSAACVAPCFAVLELGRTPASWRDGLAFVLLGAGAWLGADRKRSPALSALPLVAGALQPLWLPAALALAVERFATRLAASRRGLSIALGTLLLGALAGGQSALAKSLLAFRESLVRPITDARNESLSSWTALAIFLVVALLVRSAVRSGGDAHQTPPGFWLLALGLQLLVFGLATPAAPVLAVVPLLCALAGATRDVPPSLPVGLMAVVAGANGLLKSGLADEPALARALRAQRAFRPDDLLLFPERPNFELEYYAERSSRSLAELARRTPGQSPLEALEVELQRAGAGRGKLWLAVDAAGRPESMKASDAGRLVWGVTVEASGLRMREVMAITSASPCSTPAAQASAGLRAGSSGFVEAELGRSYAPERAVDGDPQTEWLAQPGRPFGWLDLSLREPRAIRAVSLLDAQNLPHRDFETRQARVELYRLGALVAAREVALVGGKRALVALSGDGIDCVRVLVLSYRGRGGGFAEVELH